MTTTLMQERRGVQVSRRFSVQEFSNQHRQCTDRLYARLGKQEDRTFESFLAAVTEQLFEPSAALRLVRQQAKPDRNACIRAYLEDSSIIDGLAADIHAWVAAAIHSGWKYERERASLTEEIRARQDFWKGIVEGIPCLKRQPVFTLDAQRAGSLSPAALLQDLATRYTRAAQALVEGIRFLMADLVMARFFDQRQWTAKGICWYGYFRYGCAEKVTSAREYRRPDRRGGGTMVREQREVQRQNFVEYHEHHLYQARSHAVGSYSRPLPARIVTWLKRTPPWILSHLRIIEGDIFLERIIRHDLAVQELQEDVFVRQEYYSPTVVLGPVSLVGWNGDDLDREPLLDPTKQTIPDNDEEEFAYRILNGSR